MRPTSGELRNPLGGFALADRFVPALRRDLHRRALDVRREKRRPRNRAGAGRRPCESRPRIGSSGTAPMRRAPRARRSRRSMPHGDRDEACRDARRYSIRRRRATGAGLRRETARPRFDSVAARSPIAIGRKQVRTTCRRGGGSATGPSIGHRRVRGSMSSTAGSPGRGDGADTRLLAPTGVSGGSRSDRNRPRWPPASVTHAATKAPRCGAGRCLRERL